MYNKMSLIRFIDRRNYDNLLDRNFNIDNLISKFYNTLATDNDLSTLTKAYILYLNTKLSDIFFNNGALKILNIDLLKKDLSNNEFKFIESKFNEELNNDVYLEKYYELVTLPNNDILVVVEEGFLKHITESKNNLLKFILSCLCSQYKFKFNLKMLLNIYIKLRMNDNYFNLLKLKVS